MQPLNDARTDPIKIENFYEAIDFPTEEELLAALEASLEQSPWLPRSAAALSVTSRDLARHWQELDEATAFLTKSDEHYLASSWFEDPIAHQSIVVEPDFMAGLAKFLMDRVLLRMREVDQAQQQLTEELAKLKN